MSLGKAAVPCRAGARPPPLAAAALVLLLALAACGVKAPPRPPEPRPAAPGHVPAEPEKKP